MTELERLATAVLDAPGTRPMTYTQSSSAVRAVLTALLPLKNSQMNTTIKWILDGEESFLGKKEGVEAGTPPTP